MKIAVTSQNRKTITEHAGKCRKFWVYNIQNEQVIGKALLELSLEQSFHESAQTADPQATHPLDGTSLLIAASAGRGLQTRLAQKGIQVVVTTETDPDRAVTAWLNGSLPLVTEPPHDCDSHHGHHHHD
ncbi:MAG TPA: NifB/NifX family molybdenum-iron cluster-binding protein [Rhodoferax sp.]